MIGEKDIDKLDSMSRITERMRSGNKRVYVDGTRQFRKASNHKEKKTLRNAVKRIEERIRNKLSDIHRSIA